MCRQGTSAPSKFLDGVHGIRVVPHAPFALEKITQQGDVISPSYASSVDRVNHQLLVKKIWQQRPGCLRPIRTCVHGDKHFAETVANVLTSLPFIVLGLQAPRKNLNTKLYANSLVGVGVASSLYHASRGRPRKYLRWLDYSMIATATVGSRNTLSIGFIFFVLFAAMALIIYKSARIYIFWQCLSRALRNENPKLLMAASAALLPVQPLMVSAVHTGMMEVAFAKRALEDPELRMAHNVHKMSSLLGGILFIADDAFPSTPFLHAGWHLAAAIGVGTCNKLLE